MVVFLQALAKAGGRAAHKSVLPRWLVHLGALGLFAVAVVDSSPIPLPLPGSTDLLLIVLVAHRGSLPWLLAAAAVLGSVLGGYITWSAGKSGGEALLKRSVPARFLERLSRWVENHSMLAVALSAMMPPPVPLLPFLLAAGALGVSRRRFLISFGAARVVRYGLITWAGVEYGRRLVGWWTRKLAGWSDVILWVFVAALVAGVVWGIWQYRRQRKAVPEERAFA